MKSLTFPLRSGSALVFWNAALEMALWGFMFTLCTTSISKILTLWPKAGFFLLFSFFFFLSAYPWNGLNLEFKSPAVLFLPLTSLENQKVGSWYSNGRPQNENPAPRRDSESWGQGLPSPTVPRVKQLGHTLPVRLATQVTGRTGSWHGSDLTSAVLFFPPQRLHHGERISESLQMKLPLRMFSI